VFPIRVHKERRQYDFKRRLIAFSFFWKARRNLRHVSNANKVQQLMFYLHQGCDRESSPASNLCPCRGVRRVLPRGGRLRLSQPAASRQILALEAELGIPLFDRIGRRIKLTSAGEDLL
jgi:Bacterial regulatory helix-turn-helix protein, lysR family